MRQDSQRRRPAPRTEPTTPPADSAFRRALPIYYALLLALLSGVGIYLLFQLRHVLIILFISLLFAAATAKPADYLQRLRIPRGVAVVLVYLAALVVLIGIGWFVLPPLFGQLANLADAIPSYVDRYQKLKRAYDQLRQEYPGLAPFEDQLAAAGARLVQHVAGTLTALPTRLFGIFLDVLSVFAISILIVTSRERLVAFTLSLVQPDHRDEWERVLAKMWDRIGHYLRAKIIEMAVIATITYLALLLIGVPYALLLAIVVGFGEAIPRIGPWLARLPLLGIAALEGWQTFALAFVASVLIENAKGYVISPLIEGDQLDIHPLLVFTAVLVGSALFGVAGAFVAVPAAAMVQVLFEEIVIPWRLAQLRGVRAESPAEAIEEVEEETSDRQPV